MKNIYFDTEFTGLHKNTTLISIGLVSHDGREFYAELIDYDQSQVDDWLRENVIENLTLPHGDGNGTTPQGIVGDREFVANALREWLEQFDSVTMVGDCLAYDWMLFCDLFGHAFNIPKNIHYIPLDLCTMLFAKGFNPDLSRKGFSMLDETNHNALSDARMIKACWDRIISVAVK